MDIKENLWRQRVPGNPREVKELGYLIIWYRQTRGRKKVTIAEEEEVQCTQVEEDFPNTSNKAHSNEKEEPNGCQGICNPVTHARRW